VISVFVPSLNEELNIRDTVDSVYTAARGAGLAVDIIVVNDGSTDRTKEVVESIMSIHPEVRLINNEVNLGMGESLRKALQTAKYEKFLIVPGDNDMAPELIEALFKAAPRADMVIAYFINREVRGVRRNVISVVFASIYMITFGIFVQYINGPCVYPTAKLRSLDLKANRFSIVVEATVKLLKMGSTYTEVAGYMQKGLAGSTSLSGRNLMEVLRSYVRLVLEIRVIDRTKFNRTPIRVK